MNLVFQETQSCGELMADIILEDVKTHLGVLVDNLGFDSELLMSINSAKSTAVQLGVSELDIGIDESTEWPTFPNGTVKALSQHYLYLKVKQLFDPTASETIARGVSSSVSELEGRIAHEVAEVLDVG